MGLEALLAAITLGAGLLTWSHQQRQQVTNARFDSIKRRLEAAEGKLEELPVKYVLKADLDGDLDDIRTWLRNINDKLDRLIMGKQNEKA